MSTTVPVLRCSVPQLPVPAAVVNCSIVWLQQPAIVVGGVDDVVVEVPNVEFVVDVTVEVVADVDVEVMKLDVEVELELVVDDEVEVDEVLVVVVPPKFFVDGTQNSRRWLSA